MTDFLFLIDYKGNSYNLILIIIDYLTKIVDYTVVRTMINTTRFTKIIINIVVRHHGLLKLIVSDKDSLFTSKF